MVKPSPYIDKMLEQRVYDDNALTFKQIRILLGKGPDNTKTYIERKLETGEWEQVWKRTNGRSPMAYRPKMNPPQSKSLGRRRETKR